MLFWEGTTIGFVVFPVYIEKIYNTPLFNWTIGFGMAGLSLLALVFMLRRLRGPLPFFILSALVVILGYSFNYSFLTSIIKRYTVPLAPLWLILIGVYLEARISEKNPIERTH